MKAPSVLSVSQLNFYVKSLIEGDSNLKNLIISGEISNFTNHYRTGHFYFTLKDEKAAVRAVMFSSANQKLRFKPENGLKVIVRCRVSIYERDGNYQLYVDDMQPDGLGALNLAFEQLKKKLEAQGLFASEKKKAIPQYPNRIALVTSPTGAAVKDVLSVLERRFPLVQVLLCPVQVQGDNAAPQMIETLELLNKKAYADTIIIGRGGGSIEDLWAFNDEGLARAIAGSKIPVISAVGHETDFTIADFAADLRAPTPSAAAELAVPDRLEQTAYLVSLKTRLIKAGQKGLEARREKLKILELSPGFQSPVMALNVHRQNLDKFSTALSVLVNDSLNAKKNTLALAAGKLDSLSPLKVLTRGYSLVFKEGRPLTDAKELSKGDFLDLKFNRGGARCEVKEISE
ncbi:MAG: exodeoxyribonuclease VII large subunit [Clostridiales bacterium]|mgnify:CR=1 FL=1|nr:exodeoxyribonuclease VII large subunit [Clostridiales bacterium]